MVTMDSLKVCAIIFETLGASEEMNLVGRRAPPPVGVFLPIFVSWLEVLRWNAKLLLLLYLAYSLGASNLHGKGVNMFPGWYEATFVLIKPSQTIGIKAVRSRWVGLFSYKSQIQSQGVIQSLVWLQNRKANCL